jgi:hypothetical protein
MVDKDRAGLDGHAAAAPDKTGEAINISALLPDNGSSPTPEEDLFLGRAIADAKTGANHGFRAHSTPHDAPAAESAGVVAAATRPTPPGFGGATPPSRSSTPRTARV